MSAIPSISPAATIPTALSTNGSARVPTQTLGQDEFLKLLVTKMQSQDPMNPQGDTEFISQMAQFTSLENSKSMQADLQSLTASGMLGRSVTIKGASSINGQQPDVTGIVTSVSMKNGSPTIEVDGDDYDLNQVLEISNPADFTAPKTISPMISPTVMPNIQAAA
jgi:flagellar basal-body rod modification protein FlgD